MKTVLTLIGATILASIGGYLVYRTGRMPAAEKRSAIAAALSSRCARDASTQSGGAPPTLALWARDAQPLAALGDYRRAVTTTSADARRYFDQGLRLIYAFNHDEAARAFAQALQLDPGCALCAWGAGEASGPNYNMPAMPDRWKRCGKPSSAHGKIQPLRPRSSAA